MTPPVDAATKLVLRPYLFLYGRCAEALTFYQSIFGGSSEIMYVKDAPSGMMPPGMDGNLIMHASFTAPSVAFFASDGMERKAVDPDAGNISICVEGDTATAQQLFNALAAGGTVKMPFEPAFWGGNFGNVVDKFGTDWLVTSPPA